MSMTFVTDVQLPLRYIVVIK